jgi:hypothetical protein
MNVTIPAELRKRLDALAAQMPGGNLSVLVEELVSASLPLYENMAGALLDARRPDGVVDEKVAQRNVALRIGKMIADALPVTHDDEGGEDST